MPSCVRNKDIMPPSGSSLQIRVIHLRPEEEGKAGDVEITLLISRPDLRKLERIMGAIAYAESMRPYFPNYFLDGRTEISDAYSERGVKPFVILRKNMLFANTEKGPNVTCLYNSLTQTAIHCGLDPLRYYDWLLRNLPADKEKQMSFDYTSYLSWSERISERLRASHLETEEKKD